MKIVYVPQHLYPALKKAGLRSQEMGDITKLLSTLSADDVAFYFHANRPKQCPIPKEISESYENLAANPAVSEDSEVVRQVLSKLLSLEHNGSSADMYEDNAVLTTDCMEEDLIILTHTSAVGEEVKNKVVFNETAFYDRIIQQLLAFQKPEQVMALPILRGWMKSVQTDAKQPRA